ncbi:MAG: response regulator transcription factor [Pseudomonadota bacterium]|nr:response regulator transcription factor [Pseudomonadota bacterium]
MRTRGFEVDTVRRGDEALAASAGTRYDAIILDLGLPDMDGMDVLGRLRRERGSDLPAIILSARDRMDDRIGGLDAGADDYIVKPFDLAELEARLRAVLRRPGARGDPLYAYGDVSFDPVSRSATVASSPMVLTRREACVMEDLVRAAGRTVVKDVLEDRVYGFDEVFSGNALEAVISRLRRRLSSTGSLVSIETMRGIGYRLRIDEAP